MVKEQARRSRVERICEQCGMHFAVAPNVVARGGGRFCSSECRVAGLTKYDRPESRACEQCGKSFPLAGRPASSRFCTHGCYALSKRKPRSVMIAECGHSFTPRFPSEARRWCSRECSGRARRTRLARTCEVCGTAFEAIPAEVAKGAGRYHSRACLGVSKRRRVDVSCERCAKVFPLRRSMASRRRFCTRACWIGPDGGSRVVACERPGCDRSRPVHVSALAKGGGKYCSRACYWQVQRAHRTVLSCMQCRRPFTTSPLLERRGRKYCTRQCYRQSRVVAPSRCRACRKLVYRPAWRRPKFCDLRCANTANRGKLRNRAPNEAERNQRILELRDAGKTAPEIRWALLQDPRCVEGSRGQAWRVSVGAIRNVISRYGKRSAARTRLSVMHPPLGRSRSVAAR